MFGPSAVESAALEEGFEYLIIFHSLFSKASSIQERYTLFEVGVGEERLHTICNQFGGRFVPFWLCFALVCGCWNPLEDNA